ncbi:MAG: sigma-70 family RNA polymerase sigma factor, partial [Bacteroidota bacterium]
SFLFKVAQNLFLHQVEHQRVVQKFLRRQAQPISMEHPQFQIEEQELLIRLEEAIAGLSEKQRVVFLLHRMDGKSYKEIAAMLDISVKSVEKRMHRALLVLRNCIPQL